MEENKSTAKKTFWKSLAILLFGVLMGILISPIKKGISFSAENCCNVSKNTAKDDEENQSSTTQLPEEN